MADFISKLKETGDASPTHFSPTSVITSQPLPDIIQAFRETRRA